MEKLLKDFDIPAKNQSEEAQKRWRSAVTIVRNRRRSFRMVADLDKRSELRKKILKTQEQLRVALCVQKAAFKFIDTAARGEYELSEEAREAGFRIHPNELASVVRNHDIKGLEFLGGVGVAARVNVLLSEGVKSSELLDLPLKGGQRACMTDWESYSVYSWWSSVTAVSDYRQSLQFKDLDKEKKKIFVQVTRDGYRQKITIYDVVVGDVIHLSIGDQVAADGIFISGYSLLIDESSLSGESEPVNINKERPFLLGGTKVQDGSGKMLVTAVGMRTEWGKLMETLSEGGEDETPLQVKLNGVATIIGKIGLAFAVLTFVVLTVRFLVEKAVHNEFTDWSSSDALKLLNYFATAVTIIVVAVPEGLPLAVTLSLAFAMKKLMNDRALVRHLSACETMGSATCICTDKTGTLTTNHMVVDKIWICGKAKEIKGYISKYGL
ncbi:hypothetical protein F0562_015601 [Nyssa sinensis]|uniref:Uncharacterized protein n=1 Tax=Nyssa sinensis TaxID=561372 RepID=A0A5J4ZLI3_9ASTE|nr:hypothetical protein F0562_015601 [Nyssa sinensis]